MFVKLLLYIKHNFRSIWYGLEWTNGQIFKLIYSKKIFAEAIKHLSSANHEQYHFKILEKRDLLGLFNLLQNQDEAQYQFFKPHDIDNKTIQKLYKNPSFIMMGVFERSTEKIVGYFFLRCFINKKGFIGRMVDRNYQRQGIASRMNDIMYHTLWENNFRCLSTISKYNKSILKLHDKDGRMKILKELPNDYLFVEILPKNIHQN